MFKLRRGYILLVALWMTTAIASATTYDIILTGGRVMDGSGARGYITDIGITDDRIVEMGDLSAVAATRVKLCSVSDVSRVVPISCSLAGSWTAYVRESGSPFPSISLLEHADDLGQRGNARRRRRQAAIE